MALATATAHPEETEATATEQAVETAAAPPAATATTPAHPVEAAAAPTLEALATEQHLGKFYTTNPKP